MRNELLFSYLIIVLSLTVGWEFYCIPRASAEQKEKFQEIQTFCMVQT